MHAWHVCDKVHAATQANTFNLKIYVGQEISAHFSRDDTGISM
jgi:hypothetical protein